MSEKKYVTDSGQYYLDSLTEAQILKDPIEQFKNWFSEINEKEISYPEAMTISTAGKDGRVSSRVVLMKIIEEDGLVFFTNYESEKATMLQENPFIACNFFWKEMQRQVRIEGKVSKISKEESNAYFQTRPKGSQIGAWISKQSGPVSSREEMDEAYAAFEQKHADEVIEVPPFWGGFKVEAMKWEFWQGRPSRLHDRIVFEKEASEWKVSRLWP